MSMPSIASNFDSQPRPGGKIMEPLYPASRSAPASCHTRRSNGEGRFSTRIRTRFALIRFQVAPLDVQRDEARRDVGHRFAADPQRRRLAAQDVPIDRLETVPGVGVARAVAFAVARVAL